MTGELDVFAGSPLAERLGRNRWIRILDLSAVSFIDAAGLRILIDAIRADPTLAIRAPSTSVRRLCALAGLDDIPHARTPVWGVVVSGYGAAGPVLG